MDKVILKGRKGVEFPVDLQVWEKCKAQWPQFKEVKRIITPPEVLELEAELKARKKEQ